MDGIARATHAHTPFTVAPKIGLGEAIHANLLIVKQPMAMGELRKEYLSAEDVVPWKGA